MTPVFILTRCGEVKGLSDGKVRTFRGIEYARCRRFGPARETVGWDGVFDATLPGTICPQPARKIHGTGPSSDHAQNWDENSLRLTIHTPENAGKRPVMVWIHGGSYLVGGSEESRYGGRRLVTAGDVVLVKISYRLGALGYLWMPERGIGNMGLEDQRTALSWVRNNIADFGGDPDNITVFGQSAGAQSIACLMATYREAPPFRKVILESPPLGISLNADRAEKTARKFERLVREESGQDIGAAPASKLIGVQNRFTKNKMKLPFMPVTEGLIPKDGGKFLKGIKMAVCYNADETAPYLRHILGPLLKTAAGRWLIRTVTRRLFLDRIKEYVKGMKAQGADIRLYRMDWHPEGNPLGCCHCIEMPFLLGEYDDWKDAGMLRGMTKEEFAANSAAMLASWTAFATNGTPIENALFKECS